MIFPSSRHRPVYLCFYSHTRARIYIYFDLHANSNVAAYNQLSGKLRRRELNRTRATPVLLCATYAYTYLCACIYLYVYYNIRHFRSVFIVYALASGTGRDIICICIIHLRLCTRTRVRHKCGVHQELKKFTNSKFKCPNHIAIIFTVIGHTVYYTRLHRRTIFYAPHRLMSSTKPMKPKNHVQQSHK